MMMAVMGMASCSDDNANDKSWNIGDATEIDYPEDYFTGGQLGTTTNNSSTAYKQPSLAVENEGMATASLRRTSTPILLVLSRVSDLYMYALDASIAILDMVMEHARTLILPRCTAMVTSS